MIVIQMTNTSIIIIIIIIITIIVIIFKIIKIIIHFICMHLYEVLNCLKCTIKDNDLKGSQEDKDGGRSASNKCK